MIFYFSGTVNSQAVANEIGSYQNERLVSIAQAMKLEQFTYSLESEEKVIFVFPIYAWSPPQLVVDFIKKLSFNGSVPSYLSVVVTCGENIGETERVIQRLFEQKSWALQSFYTLVMPNNYLILGTVDSKEERREKLHLVKEKILHLNKSIAHLKVERQLIKGSLPKLLTTVGGRLFHSFGRSVKPFFANDHCISCKVCEKICPTGCITVEGKPMWEGECTQCLACLHYCPKSAIQYGHHMGNKSRYTHPDILWYQLNQTQEVE